MRYLMFIMLCVFLASCGDARGSLPTGHESAGVEVAKIGFQFLMWGSIVAGLAVALRLAITFGALAFLGPFASFVPSSLVASVAETAGIIAIIGATLQWIGNHFWIVTCACIVAGLAYAWWHRTDIRYWFHFGPADSPAAVPAKTVI